MFSQGKFDAARQAALPCIDAKPTRVERSRTLALLSRIFLVQDDQAAAEATLTRLLGADPEFQPDIFDAPRFVRLVSLVKGRNSTPTVTSVSKAKEPLAQAPATVAVITGAEIERRGGKVVRPAGPMKHGKTVIAFVEDPDGYRIELIQARAS